MKCSLLTLSTFIDDELPAARRAEVDAHLVGCPRCSAGAATLREEKARVAQLARVHVDEASAQVMLEQVGILDGPATPTQPSPSPAASAGRAPWEGGATTPTPPPPPTPVAAAIEEANAPDVSPHLQPDLPFGSAGRGEVAGEPDEQPIGTEAESWEADLPPPVEPTADGGAWAEPSPARVEPAALLAPPPPPVLPPSPAAVPTRLPATSGPSALWSRARDAVAVRLALSRGGADLDDSVRIVSGGPSRRGAELPAAPPEHPPQVVEAAAAAAGPLEAEESSVELNGFRGVRRPTHALHQVRSGAAVDVQERRPDRAAGSAPPMHFRPGENAPPAAPREPVVPPRNATASTETDGWNAFAASSYPPEDAVAERVPATPSRPLGRHGRAVARERVGIITRLVAVLSTAAAATASAFRGGMSSATGGARTRLGRVSKAGPDNRLLAGIAAIGLIFVIVLLVRHASPSVPHTATAARATPSTAATAPPPQSSRPAQTNAPPSTAAVAPVPVQTFGSGATGFQLDGVRYGKQAAFLRMVFDLSPSSGAATGTPRVTIAFSNPKTMLVTLNGTAPAASVATPHGTIISSITLVSGSAQRSEYRVTLTRAATVRAFFLQSPTRFVLDLH